MQVFWVPEPWDIQLLDMAVSRKKIKRRFSEFFPKFIQILQISMD